MIAYLTGTQLLAGAVAFGFLFGWLLQKGGVTSYNVIVNQFRLKDFTVLKVMFTAIVVGGIGVALLNAGNLAEYHVKAAPMLAIVLGALIFGAGMVLYGFCPGTGLAAVATGNLHALAGFGGMLLGGMLYAFTFPWVQSNILNVADVGKMTLPSLTGLPAWVWFAILLIVALAVFALVERHERSRR